ncbi:MAG: iron-sulfur cluster-binding protein [bacterium]|nr:MAG: iron-sulfur cluster-binding protein [bacterium]KAF0147875.1 MAG: iron-sulfur cluster-binding protein [bacterium]KAF0167476.1 MAG: iron-sulfur cluster-binding protein [bacterium]TXT20988.1 MAG: iron-sulfur cluster-binding protein [bacterium]
MENAGKELYFKRVPIVPRSIRGPFRRFKTGILWLGFAIYFLLPWLPWSRGDAPSQAVMFDIPGRRYLIFDLTVYPQDVFWLAMLLFIAAVLLFFTTALVGRAFCGYFCFQTLWTDAFIWLEHVLQGERPARLRLARESWRSRDKLLKVGATRLAWVLLSFWTALTFVLYFGHAPSLLHDFFLGHAPAAAYITTLALTLSTYLSAGVLREHVCTFICPYGRFQGAMYEPETLTVHYDRARGEGAAGRVAARSGLRERAERGALGHGDCVDCGLCVQVCPVGIDIRDGLQYTCISCGLCVDACNSIMDRIGWPRGLVRYDSETNLARAEPGPVRLHWKNLKVLGYGVALVLMTAYLVYDMSHRDSFEHSIQQIRQPLYVVLSDGSIRNRYQIRLTNLSGAEETYHIEARGLPPDALDLGSFRDVRIRNGKSVIVQASVKLDPEKAAQVSEFEFVIRSGKGDVVVDPARFFTRH